MGEVSNMVSTISALLFLASTVINIYLTMRLAKLENSMNKYIDEKISEATEAIESRARTSRNDLRDELLRDIDQVNKRVDRIRNGD